MCGRTKLTATGDDLREAFDLVDVPDLAPRFNVAPSQPIAIVREPRRLELLRWGLVLGNATPGAPRINVRLESVARAPAYRDSFRTRRCLVVVDGFYEWKSDLSDPKAKRRPHVVKRPDDKPFALGGIWNRAVTSDGEVVESCAVITGEARGVLATIHNRMPLVIAPASYGRWLDPAADVSALLVTRADDLVAYPVSDAVSSPNNDDARCIEPAGDAAASADERGKTLRLF